MTGRNEIREHLRFLAETAEHQLEVLHNDGLYRHLRFRKPGTGMWGWDIITSPGLLTLHGDAVGTRVFSRTADMLEFFRTGRGPNFGYWAEKQVAGTPPREFTTDAFLRRVTEHLDDLENDGSLKPEARANVMDDLREYVEDGYVHDETSALHALESEEAGGHFTDAWDWDLTEYDCHYLRGCFAITTGIRLYDEAHPLTATSRRRPADATLSDDGNYRWDLTRWWAQTGPALTFIMLNPSTADATEDDPTIRRCIDFAKRRGFAGLRVLNLYSWRSTDPKALGGVEDPVGSRTDELLQNALHDAYWNALPVVAAWGANAAPERVQALLDMRYADTVLYALGEPTKAGAPRHPLYLPKDAPLAPWAPPAAPATVDAVDPDDEELHDAMRDAIFGRPVEDVRTALV